MCAGSLTVFGVSISKSRLLTFTLMAMGKEGIHLLFIKQQSRPDSLTWNSSQPQRSDSRQRKTQRKTISLSLSSIRNYRNSKKTEAK